MTTFRTLANVSAHSARLASPAPRNKELMIGTMTMAHIPR